jgi:nucleoid DNA-binding protein
MAQSLPVELVNYINKQLAGRPRFFQEISAHTNHVGKETTTLCYVGLVAFLKEELKRNGAIRLPDIGDLVLVKQKARMGLVGELRTVIPESEVLRFVPNRALIEEIKKKRGNSLPQIPIPKGLPTEYRVEE